MWELQCNNLKKAFKPLHRVFQTIQSKTYSNQIGWLLSRRASVSECSSHSDHFGSTMQVLFLFLLILTISSTKLEERGHFLQTVMAVILPISSSTRLIFGHILLLLLLRLPRVPLYQCGAHLIEKEWCSWHQEGHGQRLLSTVLSSSSDEAVKTTAQPWSTLVRVCSQR